MFRKPKRKAKESLRRKEGDDDTKGVPSSPGRKDDDDQEEDTDTRELLEEAKKRLKQGKDESADGMKKDSGKSLLHTFDSSKSNGGQWNAAALATSTAMHHPDSEKGKDEAGRGSDGIFREGRNKFWAGPIKAPSNVRVTARFDYQPDICKDYKETGFCGFGDTCIYLHDRGDQLAGWQVEEKWQEEQRLKKERQEKEMNDFLEQASSGKIPGPTDGTDVLDDGLPFACYLCRGAFEDPVVTACQHYFCEDCIMSHVRKNDSCPVCQKETHRVFNEPAKLMAKKKQVLGAREAKQEGSWKAFFDSLSK